MTQLTAPRRQGELLAEPPAARSAGWSLLVDYAQLAKVRITSMVVVTTWLGYLMASGATGDAAAWPVVVAAMAGAAMACMGASALNQLRERDIDALMHRTRQRPLPAGRVSPTHALVFGLTLTLAGVTVLAVGVNLLAAALAGATVASYVLIYTPLKRRTSLCVVIGAAPGALPPLIGYAAVNGTLGAAAWAMFAVMFMWQVPHFMAIAWLWRDDYARAALPLPPVTDPTGASTFRQMVIGAALLLPLGLAPAWLGLGGALYLIGAAAAGAAFVAFAAAAAAKRTNARARAVFIASLVYLPVVLALMVIDKA